MFRRMKTRKNSKIQMRNSMSLKKKTMKEYRKKTKKKTVLLKINLFLKVFIGNYDYRKKKEDYEIVYVKKNEGLF